MIIAVYFYGNFLQISKLRRFRAFKRPLIKNPFRMPNF